MPFLPRFLPNPLHSRFCEQIRQAVRSDIDRAQHRLAGLADLLDQVAVSELGVLAVSIEQGVGTVGLDALDLGDGVGQPTVIGLTRELQNPARHRDADPIGGELLTSR